VITEHSIRNGEDQDDRYQKRGRILILVVIHSGALGILRFRCVVTFTTIILLAFALVIADAPLFLTTIAPVIPAFLSPILIVVAAFLSIVTPVLARIIRDQQFDIVDFGNYIIRGNYRGS